MVILLLLLNMSLPVQGGREWDILSGRRPQLHTTNLWKEKKEKIAGDK